MMKNTTLFLCSALFSLTASAQVFDGNPADSTIISFDSTTYFSNTGNQSNIDTSGMGIWQIGTSAKSIFQDGNADSAGIVTDRFYPYPVNANSSFILHLKFPNTALNPIVTFRHRYETRAGKDGCIVEYATDSGAHWTNVKGGCNADQNGNGWGPGIYTSNFYGVSDTLQNGDTAFSGSSNGWIVSRIQFMYAIPLKTTGVVCSNPSLEKWLRFRFASDNSADTLAGWMIDQIVVENDNYSGAASTVQGRLPLKVYPNPSADGRFRFPELEQAHKLSLIIYNAQGTTVYQGAYSSLADLSRLPAGLYCYRVWDDSRAYSGTLLKE